MCGVKSVFKGLNGLDPVLCEKTPDEFLEPFQELFRKLDFTTRNRKLITNSEVMLMQHKGAETKLSLFWPTSLAGDFFSCNLIYKVKK